MPDFLYEEKYRRQGFQKIIGVDEVGRGPWAGPVVACAAYLDMDRFPRELQEKLDDSKKLTEKKRNILAPEIASHALFAFGEATVAEIDSLNILQASLLAMRRAVENLATEFEVVAEVALVDGNKDPKFKPPRGLPTELIVKGDAKSLSISAASILAKVKRDRLMKQLAIECPGYSWESNAGYGTKAHQAGLDRLGVTIHHRRSFKPIKLRLNGEEGL